MTKNKQTPTIRHKITTMFGYGLIAAMILSFVLTTALPLSLALQYSGARHFNIIVLIVVFAVAMILPPLVAYFTGDASTRSKKQSLHHYNGVLFAFVAYWLGTLLSWIGFTTMFGLNNYPYPVSLAATSIVPVVLTLIFVAALSLVFAKNQKTNTSVLEYRPFQIILPLSVAAAVFVPYLMLDAALDFVRAIIVGIVIPVAATAVAYGVLSGQKLSRLARLSDAIIAMSIGWITVWVADSFISFLQLPYDVSRLIAYGVALVVFVAYLFLRVRK